MSIKAVIFDIDGTLYPNWKMFVFSIPFFLSRPRLVSKFGKIRKEIRKTRPIENFYRLQGELLGRELGISAEEAETLIREELYGRWQRIFSALRPFPEVKTVIEELRLRGIKLALLSDFPVYPKLRLLGLEGYWEAEISTEDVGYLKPNPEPFLAAAAAVEEESRDCLYVGNNYSYDVVGAKGVGMKTAHLTKRPYNNSLADFSFPTYNSFMGSFNALDKTKG